ncbi:MAG: hypothetical protein RLZZ387_5541 [Chloroflexota bacterium]|jgi:hypothetical protein
MNPFNNRKPIVDPSGLYGREAELRAILGRLEAHPPQCCAVVGETRTGRTSLLYALPPMAGQRVEHGGIGRESLVFAYVNAGPYADFREHGSQGALFFWRDVAKSLARALNAEELFPHSEGPITEATLLDAVYELRDGVERLVARAAPRTVVLLIDNIEGVAALPPHTGRFLRSLVQDQAISGRVAYVVTSRVPPYRLFGQGAHEPSSFWALFGSPLFLAPLPEPAARELVRRVGEGRLSERDERLALRVAGRHPELLNIVCAELYERHAAGDDRPSSEEALVRRASAEARPVLETWWSGLRDTHGQAQEVLAALAHGHQPVVEGDVLEELERRGLAEQDGRRWRVGFALLQSFVVQQTAWVSQHNAAERLVDAEGGPAFTHLEGQVYAFLEAHAGRVCGREAIKQAIWQEELPSDSALQKIIERIREKIEPDPKSPRRLIAVRGQGYMLRPDGERRG